MVPKKRLLVVVTATIVCFSMKVYSQGSLDQQVNELSAQITKEMLESKKATIAVIEFSDLQGRVTDFGRFLAEELITQLHQTKRFTKVIERLLLNKIIEEQKLTVSGMIDESSAKQLGRILGVDAIVSGTVADLAQSLRVNARLISTETGEIFAVASTEVFKDESVLKLIGSVSGVDHEKVSTSKASKPASSARRIDAKGFTFEFITCKRAADNNLLCELLVTNNEPDDRPLHITQHSRVFDQSGNEYKPAQITFANSSDWFVEKILIAGIPTRVLIEFRNVATTASRVAMLDLAFNYAGSTYHIKFRDLPIQD